MAVLSAFAPLPAAIPLERLEMDRGLFVDVVYEHPPQRRRRLCVSTVHPEAGVGWATRGLGGQGPGCWREEQELGRLELQARDRRPRHQPGRRIEPIVFKQPVAAGDVGKLREPSKRGGRLLLLAPNLKDELARIELSNLGIIALRPRVSPAGISQLEAESYVERLALSVGGK